MALNVAPVRNPTFGGIGAPPPLKITSVGVAHPPTLTNLQKPKAPSAGFSISRATQENNSLQAQTNALLAAINSMQNSQPRQVYAPALNFAAVNASARKAAEKAVNPYYVKQLNDFLAEQGAKRKQAEVQAKTNTQTLTEDLQSKLDENALQQARTGEDVTQNIDTLNTQADQFQTDTGQQFDTDRLTQARELAAAGLTGGIGAQQAEATQTARNTTEERQTATTDQAKQQQQLFKARTFEDLSRSGSLATTEKNRGVKQVKVDLADFITNQGFETKSKKSQLEAQRIGAVIQEQSNQGRLAVNKFINRIADPASRNAAVQAYGSLF